MNKKGRKIEAEACLDHIHLLVSIPPYLSISQFMEYLKEKSSLMIFDRHENLKYKYMAQGIWVQRILCRYSREERNCDHKLHPKPIGRRLCKGD